MSSDDDSESEEEISDLLKEAANCDYVNKLYSNSYIDPGKPKKDKSSKPDQEDKSENILSSHQIFLAKALTKKLDDLITIVEDKTSKTECEVNNPPLGIRLFNDSLFISEPQEESIEPKRRKVDFKKTLSCKEYKERAKEASVTPDWVLSNSNTEAWHFYKPKVIYMNGFRNKDGKLECEFVGKTF